MGACFSNIAEDSTNTSEQPLFWSFSDIMKFKPKTEEVTKETQVIQEPSESNKEENRNEYIDPLQITLETPITTNDNISDISMESSKESISTSENGIVTVLDYTAVEEYQVNPTESASSSIIIPVDTPQIKPVIESQMDETLLHAFCEDVLHVIHTSVTETGRPKYEDVRYVDNIQDIKQIVLSAGKRYGSWEKVKITEVVFIIRMLTYQQIASKSSSSEPITAEMIYKKKLEENQIVE